MNRLFKLLLAILLLFVGIGAYAQCPENIGFEDGSLKNWQIYAGQESTGISVPVTEVSEPQGSRVVIMRASDKLIDPYGHFPTTSPNGSGYAVRLGDDQTRGMIDRLTYTFTVPASGQYGLIVNYAAVLQNPNHTDSEQPRFKINAYNVTDNKELDCPAFNFTATNSNAFKLSDIETTTTGAGGNVDVTSIYYRDWTTTTINLIGYAGKTIRLIFNNNDCTKGGHFGYAYFDINEQCSSPVTGNTYCEGQSFLTLRGPRGFTGYKWYTKNDMNTVLDTTQVLKLSPAPPAGAEYALVIDAIDGLGCRDTLYTTIFKSPATFTFKVKQPVFYICEGGTFNLTTPDITAGSSTGLLPFEYYTDPVTEAYLRDPDKLTKPGIYYIKATNDEGCSNTLPVELKYFDPPATVTTNPAPVQYPKSINLSTTFQHDVGYTYTYYKDAKATQLVDDPDHVVATGKYYIKVITGNGCQKIVSVNVTVLPPPPYIISGPTAFTPNSDGINDLFNITIDGFVDFTTVSIYTRSGQFLFKANKQAMSWDGSFNGKPMPPGTYYWLFEGVDQYYHTKVNKGGYVSIIK
ncbi:T9SS type B sorting domain-containing protein [Mucilaginibacter calamicampi]|uniref:T9SS type B sorting domain-containing protein n=1 Tax=Mucilaginibacter calamicampi TaxID=1302352 RepID=A0ABW2YUG0_9SPHI